MNNPKDTLTMHAIHNKICEKDIKNVLGDVSILNFCGNKKQN